MLVSVLFGATLFGIIGALLAIPIAATIQISIQEWWRYRVAQRLSPPPAPEAPPDEPPPAGAEPVTAPG